MTRRVLILTCAATAVACSSQGVGGPGPAAVACRSSTLTQIDLAVGAYALVNPAADSGCLVFAANPTGDSVQYLVVPQAAGGTPGDSTPFTLQGGSAAPGTASATIAARRAQRSRWARLRQMGPVPLRFAHTLHEQRVATAPRVRTAMRRAVAGARLAAAGPPALGSRRTFSVCGDYACSHYVSVGAKVQSVGAHIAVYVDTTAPAPPDGATAAQIDTLRAKFDTLYTIDTVAFGGLSDIDSNGVVLMVMTPVVNDLVSNAECMNGGYVAGFFNPIDLDQTQANSNKGEIFYTIVADSSGILPSCSHYVSDLEATLPTTFLHELQHVISFNQHVLLRGGQEESLWLDEALSSFAEELGGRHYLPDSTIFTNYLINVVSDAYTYLQDPSRHFLLQQSDTVLADFGAGWLYMRYLMDQFGGGLTLKLEQTTDTGTINVAAQTGLPFATTAGRWALANWVSDLPGFTPPAELRYTSWSFRAVFASLNSQLPEYFPDPYPLYPTAAAGPQLSTSGFLDAGSGAYVLALQGALAPAYSMLLSAKGRAISPVLVPQLDVVRIR